MKGTTRWPCERALPVRDDAAELSSHERAGLVAYLLTCGARLSDGEVAELTGLKNHRSGWWLTQRLSRVIPIRRSDEDNRWELVSEEERGAHDI